MAILKVYNGEYFDRKYGWYVVFGLILLGIIAVSVYYENIIGALLIIVLVGGYLYMQTKVSGKITLSVQEEGIIIGKRMVLFSLLKGFVLEADKKHGKVRNIVFIFKDTYEIFTINDSPENIDGFLFVLKDKIPPLQKYDQSIVDKLLRKLKV